MLLIGVLKFVSVGVLLAFITDFMGTNKAGYTGVKPIPRVIVGCVGIVVLSVGIIVLVLALIVNGLIRPLWTLCRRRKRSTEKGGGGGDATVLAEGDAEKAEAEIGKGNRPSLPTRHGSRYVEII